MSFGRRGLQPDTNRGRGTRIHSADLLAYALMQPDAVLGPVGRLWVIAKVCALTIRRAFRR